MVERGFCKAEVRGSNPSASCEGCGTGRHRQVVVASWRGSAAKEAVFRLEADRASLRFMEEEHLGAAIARLVGEPAL